MAGIVRLDRCITPFRQIGEKGHVGKDLRPLSEKMKLKFPHLPTNSKICSECRKNAQSNSLSDNNQNKDDSEIGQSVQQEKSIDSNISADNSKSARDIELEELLTGLREKYKSLEGNDPLKIRILTIAPSSWSINKIVKEFDASRRLARESKTLKLAGGVLAETIAKTNNKLPISTVEKVKEFFNEDSNSRIMPGQKDKISVVIDGKRVQMQKRLMLLDLKESYRLFKEGNPTIDLGFSTFAKLRPKNCILAGASGTHSVCVCTMHQNCKLMLDAIDVKKLTQNSKKELCNYKDCLREMMCEDASAECHLNECKKCPSIEIFSSKFLKILNEENVSEVEYSTWTGTDRSTLQTVKLNIENFIEELCDKLQALKPHSFIAKQQTSFIAEKKKNLCKGEDLIMFDFSENYKFVVQDASQAFHFNNDQCTVFPIIYYYKEGTEVVHKTCVFLSNSLKHDTAAVFTIQNLLIPEIKKNVGKIIKIVYVTDGAKQHFKNRFQISNVINHKNDFDIEAEWHYCATAHGKSCYDGIGATFKREAYRASLMAKPKDAILNHEALTKWANNHFKVIKIFYSSQVEHEKMRRKLNKRFESAKPVPEILKNHFFQILSGNRLLIKVPIKK